MKTAPSQFQPLRARRLLASRLFLPAFLAFVAGTTGAAAATRTVTSLADDGGAGTLRSRISQAAAGDTIDFSVIGTIELAGSRLEINKNLTVHGPGREVLTIDAGHKSQVVYIGPGSTVALSGIKIFQGRAGKGAGIYSDRANLKINDCLFGNNYALSGDQGSTDDAGGALFATGTGASGTVGTTITNTRFSSNATKGLGEAIYNEYTQLTVDNSDFSGNGNADNFWRGALYNVGAPLVVKNHCKFDQNGAGGIYSVGAKVTIDTAEINRNARGGGIVVSGGALQLTRSSVTGNDNDLGGGGITLEGSGTTANPSFISNTVVTGNASMTNGGGVSSQNSVVQFIKCTLSNNTAYLNGAGVYSSNGTSPTVSFTDCTVANNKIDPNVVVTELRGAGVYSQGTLSMTRSTVSGNSFVLGGQNAYQAGAGLYLAGPSTFQNSTIANNSFALRQGKGSGGGIASSSGDIALTGCSLYGNLNAEMGAGIFCSGGALSLVQCTVANQEAQSFGGGILFSANNKTLSLASCTIAGNDSRNEVISGSIHCEGVGSTFALANSIVTGDIANSMTFVDGGFNLLRGAPNLSPLQDNGGPTLTMMPLSPSPAIDQSKSLFATDQTGFARVQDAAGVANAPGGNGADIGAVESRGLGQTFLVNTLDDIDDGVCNDAHCSLREAIAASVASTDADVIRFVKGQVDLQGTIVLTRALPVLTGNLFIMGPGPNALTVARSSAGGTPAFRIFQVSAQASVYIAGLSVTNGSFASGGGLLNDGELTLRNMTIAGNTATGEGGGILNRGTLTLSFSTISGNSATSGGGLLSDTASNARLDTCTVADNTATSGGGGLRNSSGELSLSSCTVAGNKVAGSTTGAGSAILSVNGLNTYTVLKHTAVTGFADATSADLSTFVSEGHNVVESGNSLADFSGPGDITGKALKVGSLDANGGPTRTVALLPGSPAIDADSDDAPTMDQRGVGRPYGAAKDIGAFEVEPPPTLTITTPAEGANVSDLPSVKGTATDLIGIRDLTFQLQRLADGLYWTGTAWGAATDLTVSVTGPGTDLAWERINKLPTGPTLPSGNYRITATVTAVARQTATATRNFSVTATPPGVAITTPAEGASVTALSTIAGTASDDTEVTEVTVRLKRTADGKFWTGGAWGAQTELSVIQKGTATAATWSREVGLPSGTDLTAGSYTVAASATDSTGLHTTAINTFTVTVPTPPTVSLTAPAAGAVLTSLPAVSGTATDAVTVAKVTFRLQRSSDGKFWTGSVWGATTELASTLSGTATNANWTGTANLPSGANLVSGSYTLTATATNAASLTTLATRSFTVPALAATAAVVTTVTTPANGSTVKALSLANGTVLDKTGGPGISKVTVTLKRVGDSKFWNGSAWVAAATALPTGVAGNVWSKTTFPAAGTNADTQLTEGQYILAAKATNLSGSISADTATSRSQFTVDRTNPGAVTIVNPPVNAKIKVLPKVNGTATDTVGVAQVVLVYKRNSDNKYWTGIAWGDLTELPTTIAGPVTNRVWSKSTGLPSGADLPLGNYGVIAIAIDGAGNRTSLSRTFNITETVPPTVAITSPVNASTVNALAQITGTANDTGGSNLQKVALTLRRMSDNKFWNGTAWVATSFDLSTSMTTAGGGVTWKSLVLPKNTNLIDGSYRAQATATDKAENVSSTVVSQFILKRTAAPVTRSSGVQLSSAAAASHGTIQLVFTGALNGSATDVVNYGVTLNGEAIEIVSAQQKSPGVVVLTIDDLTAGAKITVTYELQDANGGSSIGSATVVVK